MVVGGKSTTESTSVKAAAAPEEQGVAQRWGHGGEVLVGTAAVAVGPEFCETHDSKNESGKPERF